MKVAILGSGPSSIPDLPARGYHTIAVGGGCKHGEWDVLFCTDPAGPSYYHLPAERGANLVVTEKLYHRSKVEPPEPWTLWKRPVSGWRVECRGAGGNAAHYAILELGATEIHLAGCDCSGDYAQQYSGWEFLLKTYQDKISMTREPSPDDSKNCFPVRTILGKNA